MNHNIVYLSVKFSAGAATFEYDAKGRQVMSAYGSVLSTVYNLLDLPQRHTTGEGTVVDYKYAFDGRKLQEKVTAGTLVTQRDYSGEFLYEGGVLKKILFDGGYVINGESGPVYMFFLKDHLGSVRAVVSETGVVQQINHYYPYGDLFPNTSNDSSGNRYKYTGKESGDETDLYDFSARILHTRFGRFTTIDPLAEKYPGISPYAYCNGNPVNFVDPDGMDFRKVVRMNTITIKAHYYVKRDSYESAANARDFWNKRQDTYLSPSGKQFDVKYKITIQSVDNIDVFKKNSNTYEVVDSFESKNRAGVAADKRNIQVLESYSLTLPNSQIQSTTGAHEIGHTLGMSDGGQGIMSDSQDESRTNDVTQDNLQQMLESAAGKDDMLSKLFNYIFKVYD